MRRKKRLIPRVVLCRPWPWRHSHGDAMGNEQNSGLLFEAIAHGLSCVRRTISCSSILHFRTRHQTRAGTDGRDAPATPTPLQASYVVDRPPNGIVYPHAGRNEPRKE